MLFSFYKRYFDFAGRSSRKEYWFGILGYLLIAIPLAIVDGIIFSGMGFQPLYSLFALASFLPLLGLGIRRLHDLDKSGWWTLIGLIPLAGLVLLYWAVQPGQPTDNRFGAPPPETPNRASALEAAETFG